MVQLLYSVHVGFRKFALQTQHMDSHQIFVDEKVEVREVEWCIIS